MAYPVDQNKCTSNGLSKEQQRELELLVIISTPKTNPLHLDLALAVLFRRLIVLNDVRLLFFGFASFRRLHFLLLLFGTFGPRVTSPVTDEELEEAFLISVISNSPSDNRSVDLPGRRERLASEHRGRRWKSRCAIVERISSRLGHVTSLVHRTLNHAIR